FAAYVLEVGVRFVRVAACVESDEQRAVIGVLAGGVNLGPLAEAAVRILSREAANLLADAGTAQRWDGDEGCAGCDAHTGRVRPFRVNHLVLHVDQRMGARVDVNVPGDDERSVLPARLVDRPAHRVALVANLHGLLFLMPAADLPGVLVSG